MKNLFIKRKQSDSNNVATRMIGALQPLLNNSSMITQSNAKNVLSMEGLNDSAVQTLTSVADDLFVTLEGIYTEINPGIKPTEAQLRAAVTAGILAGDYKKVLSHKVDFPAVSTESMGVVQSYGVADSLQNRSFGLEAYDERENRNAALYSMTYNMQAAVQDEFGETFFPTITMSPDQVGFGITITPMMVYSAIEHNISGTFQDFNKKNIIRAVADSTILHKDQTKIVPVYRAQSADKFADTALIPSYNVIKDNEVITTAPLAINKKLNLLGLAQTDTLLAGGTMDQTDTLDPAIALKALYIKFGNDKVKFNTLNIPLSQFTYAVQGNYRLSTLNMSTTSLLINLNTKQIDNTALVTLAPIVTGNYIVRVEVQASGSVNIETGETTVFGNSVHVHSVAASDGTLLDLETGVGASISALVNAGTILGYDLQAYLTNANRRQRGQFIDVTRYTQMYSVPLLSPISTIHPSVSDGQADTSDVEALILATHIRTSNASVTALLSTAQTLSEYVDARDASGVGPEVLGVGRFFIIPQYRSETLDMLTIVDSIASHERAADLQAALVNKIRDHAYRMYRDSEYPAAADAIAGGPSKTPTVIIGTDPVIARYLTVSGDLRTLGDGFEVRIVSTLDHRMTGKIIVTFGVFDSNRNTTPHPLNFGNMAWCPELVLSANISRNNTLNKETVVQPRFLFVNHLPLLTVLEIENIPDILEKVTVNTNAV